MFVLLKIAYIDFYYIKYTVYIAIIIILLLKICIRFNNSMQYMRG
jgi:hypothetical protein